jgi:hypothetical protein
MSGRGKWTSETLTGCMNFIENCIYKDTDELFSAILPLCNEVLSGSLSGSAQSISQSVRSRVQLLAYDTAQNFFKTLSIPSTPSTTCSGLGSPLVNVLRATYCNHGAVMPLFVLKWLHEEHNQYAYNDYSVMLMECTHTSPFPPDRCELRELYELFGIRLHFEYRLPDESDIDFQRRFSESEYLLPCFVFSNALLVCRHSTSLRLPDETCAICLNKMTLEQTELNCGHLFCNACVGEWYAVNRTCALCRAPTTSVVSRVPTDA